jgi:SAM-dependent methyltransferase
LIPDDALADDGWTLWKRHLDGFQARRELPGREHANLLQRATVQSDPLFDEFGRFTRIVRGRVLDIGCGPGTLRRHLGADVEYHGLDPIALPAADTFDYVRAVVEFLPFADDTFDEVVTVSAVDHFRDVDVAFDEVRRVLRPGGQVHLVQSVHDVHGPLTMVKFLTHAAKDLVETRATRSQAAGAPKHITEFTRATLRDTLSRHFSIVRESSYSKRWYSPENRFVTLAV